MVVALMAAPASAQQPQPQQAPPPPAPSQADLKLLQGYTLTLDKLKHFSAADKALYDASAKDATLKAEIDKMADEEPQATLADLQAKLTRHPRVAGFYRKEGLSDQEAIVIPLATMDALTQIQTPQVALASPGQLDFVRQHRAEIEPMVQEWSKEENDDD